MGMPLIEVRTQEKEHIRHGGGFLMQGLLTSAFIYLPVIDPSSSWEGQVGTGAGMKERVWHSKSGNYTWLNWIMLTLVWKRGNVSS